MMVNSAIAILDAGGVLTNGGVSSLDGASSMGVDFSPPVDDPSVINAISRALDTQANTIKQQLSDLGYTA